MHKFKEIALRKIVLAICGKKGLDLSSDERRAIQQDVIGVASLKDMCAWQLDDLIFHLRKLQRQRTGAPENSAPAGAAKQNEWKFVFKLTADRQAHAKKIYRLAERIGALMKPPAPVASKAYIEGIARQMRGCEQPLEFCDAEQLHKIVQALETHVKRHGG